MVSQMVGLLKQQRHDLDSITPTPSRLLPIGGNQRASEGMCRHGGHDEEASTTEGHDRKTHTNRIRSDRGGLGGITDLKLN